MAGDEVGHSRRVGVVEAHKGFAYSISEQEAVTELTQQNDVRLDLRPIGRLFRGKVRSLLET